MKCLVFFAVIFSFFCLVSYAQDMMDVDSESYSGSEFDPFNNRSFSDNRRKAAKALIYSNRNTSRYIFFTNNKTFRKVPPVFCLPEQSTYEENPWTNITGPRKIKDCQWKMYGESVLLIPGIAVVVAILVWPIGQALVTSIRGCACGMCRPRKGCCCCGESADDFSALEDGYSDCTRAITFVFAMVAAVILLVGLIVGLIGHTEITENLEQLVNYVQDMVNTFVDILNSTAYVINQTAADFDEYIDYDLVNLSQRALNWTDSLYDGIGTAKSYIYKVDTPRQAIMYISLVAPFICATLVVVGCLLCSACSCFMIAFGFIFTFLALVVFAMNYPISYSLSDGCVYLENAMDKSNPEYVDTVAMLFDCDENSPISNFSRSVRDKIDSLSGNVCTFIDKLNQIKTLPCENDNSGLITPLSTCNMFDPPENAGPCTINNIEEYLNYTFYTYPVGCYISLGFGSYKRIGECGDERIKDSFSKDSCDVLYPGQGAVSMYCGQYNGTFHIYDQEEIEEVNDPNIRGNATLLMRITNAQLRLLDVYREKIRPFLKCETITDILYYAKDFACVSLILGTTPVFAGEMIVAIGSLMGTIVAMLAIKRFNKEYLISRAEKAADRELLSLVS